MIVVLKKTLMSTKPNITMGFSQLLLSNFSLKKKMWAKYSMNLYDQAQNIFGQNSTQQTHPNKSRWSSEKVQGFDSKMPSSCRATRLTSIQL